MNTLKLIGMTLVQLGKQLCLLPKALIVALTKFFGPSALAKQEAERLDRIRNPSKYRGK
jgi:hypothetical protein